MTYQGLSTAGEFEQLSPVQEDGVDLHHQGDGRVGHVSPADGGDPEASNHGQMVHQHFLKAKKEAQVNPSLGQVFLVVNSEPKSSPAVCPTQVHFFTELKIELWSDLNSGQILFNAIFSQKRAEYGAKIKR